MSQKKNRIQSVCLMNMCMIEDGTGNVLVLDKANSSYTGITFPGGHVERGESYSDSMIREVKEETGLLIEKPVLQGVYHWEKDDVENIIFLYKTDKYSGTLQSSSEGNVFWLPKEEFLNQKLAGGMDSVWKMMHDDEINECHVVKIENTYLWKL